MTKANNDYNFNISDGYDYEDLSLPPVYYYEGKSMFATMFHESFIEQSVNITLEIINPETGRHALTKFVIEKSKWLNIADIMGLKLKAIRKDNLV